MYVQIKADEWNIELFDMYIEVKSMQRLGTEATRPKIQPSKPKREIT